MVIRVMNALVIGLVSEVVMLVSAVRWGWFCWSSWIVMRLSVRLSANGIWFMIMFMMVVAVKMSVLRG